MKKALSVTILLLLLTLLGLHLFQVPFINIDNTTLFFILLIILTPQLSSIKKLKWGEFEAEIRTLEVNKVTNEIQNLPKTKTEDSKAFNREIEHFSNDILNLGKFLENQILRV